MTGTEQSPTAPAEAEKRTAHEALGKSSSLLLRIAQRLRNQHWVAIGIEFLVVIFGVFLGFQLTSWNETRQQADIERAMLIRLGKS